MNALVKYTTESPYGKSDECAKLSIFDTAEWFILADTTTVGIVYTFSAWIKSDADGSFTVGESYIRTTPKWARYKATFTADDVDLKLIFSTPGTYYLYNTQLEIGNIASDWSPSPEDLDETLGEYYTKEETNSIFEQTSSNILLAVEGKFTQKLENYYTKEETNSAINMTADNINLSVNSKIESAEGKFTQKLENYYTKEETNSAIDVKSNEINLSVNSKIESVQVGGRNLLLKSNPNKSTDVFGVSNFYFGDVKPTEGETYTLTIKGVLGSDRTRFMAYNSGNKVKFANLKDNGDGTYTATDTWKITDGTNTADNTYLRVFQYPNTGTSTSTIEWIQLERGNKSTDWSPAPEDVATVEDIELISDDVTIIHESIAALNINAGEISASVAEIKSNTESALNNVTHDIETLTNEVSAKMSAEAVELQIRSAISNGTHKVTTETGFTFDDEGLTIEKSGSEMKTQITEDGMTVYQNEESVLVADNKGVDAKNLHATTYLIVGGRSRFENYGSNRTGCFWIGG